MASTLPPAHPFNDLDEQRAVTLSDVANEAGVSIGTASKALNGRFDVAAATRDRVLNIASQMGFVPNALARGLSAGKSHTVGILTNDLQGRFVPQIMHGAESEIGREDSTVLLSNSDGEPTRQARQLRSLLERRVDGLIIVDEWMEERAPIPVRGSTPVVYVFGASSNPEDISVVPDVHEGGRLAASHLIEIGRRNLAHIGGEIGAFSADQRAAGFHEALREADLYRGYRYSLRGDYSEQWGWEATGRLLAEGANVDAIFAGNDQIARGAVDRLQMEGRSVPEDVAVIGYDNWEVLSLQGRLPITTIDMRLDILGAEAVRQLYGEERVTGKILVSPGLVRRASTMGR